MIKHLFFIFLFIVVFGQHLYAQPTIRVAHMNIGELSMGKKNQTIITKADRELKVEAFKELFNKVDADILGLCEYAPFFSLLNDSTEDKEDKTEDAILNNYSHFAFSERTGRNCNIIASKLELSNQHVVVYSKGKANRGYTVGEFEWQGKIVKVVETHFDVSQYKAYRDIQIKELISAFENEPYVIICGDFNLSKVSWFDVFKEHGFIMCNHGAFGSLYTYPSTRVGGYGLDNIMCKGFDIVGVQVYNSGLSDHFLIACDLVLK